MTNPSNFLTEVAKDWPESSLAVLQEVLAESETAMLDRTNTASDPLLDSPNLPNVRGYMRWAIVQACLERAVISGRLPGITCNWVSLGGVSVLELAGEYTTVTPYHLHYEDDIPRDSNFRESRRGENEVSPFLFSSAEMGDAPKALSEKIHLLLVHGGKDGVFAYLRVYYDRERRSLYRPLSPNIMTTAVLLPIESELVLEPQVQLKDTKRSVQSSA